MLVLGSKSLIFASDKQHSRRGARWQKVSKSGKNVGGELQKYILKSFGFTPYKIKLLYPIGQFFYIVLNFNKGSLSNSSIHISKHTQ